MKQITQKIRKHHITLITPQNLSLKNEIVFERDNMHNWLVVNNTIISLLSIILRDLKNRFVLTEILWQNIVVIAGGSSGIGRAIIRSLLVDNDDIRIFSLFRHHSAPLPKKCWQQGDVLDKSVVKQTIQNIIKWKKVINQKNDLVAHGRILVTQKWE